MPTSSPALPRLCCALLLCFGLAQLPAMAADVHGTISHETPPATQPPAAPVQTAPAAPAPVTTGTALQPAPGDPQLAVDRIKAVLARRASLEKTPAPVGEESPKTRPPAQGNSHNAGTASSHGKPSTASHARAKAAALTGHEAPSAHGGEVHWDYEGHNGPEHWGQLKPEFNACAIGQRQTPIHIQETQTLQGPAEPLQFDYRPSSGSVVNNGHTIQVDLEGENTLTVRGSTYRLLQFHFHHPSEEKINQKGFSMVAHLVHRNEQGQLAVVAVLIDPGEASPLIQKVWTHMPLDVNDRVRLPEGLIDMAQLLPQDQRYYQFMGSLTTPPCTEGVLWMVLKQPMTVSREQLRLFAQLFPMNARPIQPVNGRVVREGM